MMLPSRLPSITIASHDHGRLQSAAEPLVQRGHSVARFLLSELDRAKLCRPDQLPEDVVAMNCRVTYRIDGGEAESRFLVYPEDYTLYGGQIPVLSAVGAALIGLRVGDAMPYRTPDGAEHSVLVERIDYRPCANVLPFPGPRRRTAPYDPGPGSAA